MGDLSALIELIAFAGAFFAVGAVLASRCCSPVGPKVDASSSSRISPASPIARKVAIAEAAIEARKARRNVLPPDDYAW